MCVCYDAHNQFIRYWHCISADVWFVMIWAVDIDRVFGGYDFMHSTCGIQTKSMFNFFFSSLPFHRFCLHLLFDYMTDVYVSVNITIIKRSFSPRRPFGLSDVGCARFVSHETIIIYAYIWICHRHLNGLQLCILHEWGGLAAYFFFESD